MDGELDPRTPEPESEQTAEQAQPAEPTATATDAPGDREISDEELDSVSGGLF